MLISSLRFVCAAPVSSYSGFLIVVGQVDGEHQFGKGQVDADGLAATGGNATGITEWVMTKVRISFVRL